MHIHGRTFALGSPGPSKDTVIVHPGQQVARDFDAENPGQWMTHCRNLYHAPQGGMMATLLPWRPASAPGAPRSTP